MFDPMHQATTLYVSELLARSSFRQADRELLYALALTGLKHSFNKTFREQFPLASTYINTIELGEPPRA